MYTVCKLVRRILLRSIQNSQIIASFDIREQQLCAQDSQNGR